MLAVLYKETIAVPGWDNGTTDQKEIQVFKEFSTEAELLSWVSVNDNATYGKKSYRLLQFQELAIERKLSIQQLQTK
jgi:hypothetical protein